MNIYECGEAFERYMRLVSSAEPLSEEDSEFLANYERREMIESAVAYIKNIKSHINGIECAINDMKERKNSSELALYVAEKQLLDFLSIDAKIGKTLKLINGDIKFPWHGGAVELLCIPEELPEEYQTIKISANKTLIKNNQSDERLTGKFTITQKERGISIC